MECPIVEMTLNSLRTFLRVRLYTAISLMVDIADTTENRSSTQISINRSSSSHLSAIASAEIRLQRLSGTNPVRYQSAIALQLASKTRLRPQDIAMNLCDAYDTLNPSLRPSALFSIEANATGWLTLSLSCTDLMAFLDQTLNHESSVSAIPPHALPFLIWQTHQRCQSLRSHLVSHLARSPVLDVSERDRQSDRQSDPTRSAFSALMESLLDWMDDEGYSKTPHKALIHVCQCLDRLHQQVPLFHPHTSQQTQHQFLRSLAWVQGAIQYEATLNK